MKNKTKISIALLVSGAMTTFAAGESVSKPIAEYVTAKDTNHRLEHVADLDFAPMPQPTEHEHCVFVDKSATFQTVLGIGGALTMIGTFSIWVPHRQRVWYAVGVGAHGVPAIDPSAFGKSCASIKEFLRTVETISEFLVAARRSLASSCHRVILDASAFISEPLSR